MCALYRPAIHSRSNESTSFRRASFARRESIPSGSGHSQPDHNIPTQNQHLPVQDLQSARQVSMLENNCTEHGITIFKVGTPKNGIIHVVGPETGLTQPGMTIVCGDSHTSTHGAMGCVAFGIGTSEVEMVLASNVYCNPNPRPCGSMSKDN